MSRLWLLGLLAVSFVGAGWGHESFKANEEFLSCQTKIYQLLYHVAQPDIVNPELYKQGEKWNVFANIHKFQDQTVVERFRELKARGTLPKKSVFTIYQESHLEQLKVLTELFITADSFDTFYNTALWARNTENEGVFVFALYTAVIHRPDTAYLKLPPLYELYPYAFYNSDVIKAINDYKITHEPVKTVSFVANYTGWNVNYQTNLENKLNYFVEDIGLNAYYVFLRLNNPFWLNNNLLNSLNYRGEEFLYVHNQLLKRYNVERAANQLPFVENFQWTEPFPIGFEPNLVYHNGFPLPRRQPYSKFSKTSYNDITDIVDIEARIRTAIDSGFVLNNKNKWVNIYNTTGGLNILGNLIEGNEDSINKNVYGSFDELSRKILGHAVTPISDSTVVPSALETFTSSLRDPAIYRIFGRIYDLYTRYKLHQHSYTKHETVDKNLSDLRIQLVNVSQLITFFDVYNSTVSNGLLVKKENVNLETIKIEQLRLNHENFNYAIQVTSKKPTKAVVKVFLGPKTDAYNNPILLPQGYKYFYEVDSWLVSLHAGTNDIVRNSGDSFFFYPDYEPSEIYYEKVQKAIHDNVPLNLEKRISGFPQRLLLPKGDVNGKQFQLFVYVNPIEDNSEVKYHSRVFGNTVFEKDALGFPLEKLVNESKNRKHDWVLKDVTIYHRPEGLSNETYNYCITRSHVHGLTRTTC